MKKKLVGKELVNKLFDARYMIKCKIVELRAEADDLQNLLDEIPEDLSKGANEALWKLLNHVRGVR